MNRPAIWQFAVIGMVAAITLTRICSATMEAPSASMVRSGKDNSGWPGALGAIGAAVGAIGSAIGAAGRAVASSAGYGPRPSIGSASAGVKVGRDGAWRDAAPGTVIGDTDFVKVPAGDQATISRSDGTIQQISGKAIVPGRWMSGDDRSGDMIWISQTVQNAAQAIVGKGAEGSKANGGGKA